MQTREKTERTSRRTDIAETARSLRDTGQWTALASHLGGISPSELTAELEIMSAHAAYMTGEAHRAIEVVDRILASTEEHPVSTRAYALLVRSASSRFRGFTQKALEDASAATAMLEAQTSPPELLIQGHKQIGICLATTGELDGAIDHLERALRHCARSSNLNLQAEIQNALGLAYFRLGRLPEAQVHYKNAAAALQKLESHSALADLYNNMGWLHFNLAEYDVALDYYQRALELSRDANYQRTVSMALVNIGDVQLAMGQHATALQTYEQALQSGADALEPRLFCCANTGMGSAHRALKDPRKARFYLDQAVFEARRLNLRHELATASMVEGELCLDEGNYQKAKECLESSVAIYQEIGALRPLVKAYLCLGQVNFRTKRWKFLNETLQALAKVVQQLDSSDNLFQEAGNARDVIEYAASKRIGGTLFSSIRSRLRGAESDAAVPIRKSSSERGTSADGSAIPTVEVRALGSLQITVDGRKVGAVEWESQKAQELFAYLVCNRQGKSREELIDVLWPELSVGLSRNAFHNNVYRTRRALYKGCVVLEEGRYLLQRQGSFWFDLDEFRRLSREAELAKACSKKQVTLLAQANRLYRGEFLSGMEAEWITPIKMEAEGLYLGNLARLAEASATRGEYPSAVAALDQALKVDPTDVETHERLVQVLVRAGNVVEARKRHEELRRMTQSELGGEPPREFSELCELASTTTSATA